MINLPSSLIRCVPSPVLFPTQARCGERIAGADQPASASQEQPDAHACMHVPAACHGCRIASKMNRSRRTVRYISKRVGTRNTRGADRPCNREHARTTDSTRSAHFVLDRGRTCHGEVKKSRPHRTGGVAGSAVRASVPPCLLQLLQEGKALPSRACRASNKDVDERYVDYFSTNMIPNEKNLNYKIVI